MSARSLGAIFRRLGKHPDRVSRRFAISVDVLHSDHASADLGLRADGKRRRNVAASPHARSFAVVCSLAAADK